MTGVEHKEMSVKNIVKNLSHGFVLVALLCMLPQPVFGQEQSPEKNKNVSSSDVKRETREAAETAGDYLLWKKGQYQKKAEDRLRRIENNVKKLYARAENKGIKLKEKMSSSADTLRKKSDKAKEKLKDLKASGEEKWETAKTELDAMIKDLEQSYKRTVSKFRD